MRLLSINNAAATATIAVTIMIAKIHVGVAWEPVESEPDCEAVVVGEEPVVVGEEHAEVAVGEGLIMGPGELELGHLLEASNQ